MSTIQILIRASLSDTGKLPRTGDVSDSPDVIPFQTEVEDPLSYFIANYDENVKQDLKATQDNFIYVRGKNLADSLQQGDIYVYFALDSQLDTPAKWTKNTLKTKDGNGYARVSAQSEGNIVVTESPFVWTPPVPQEGQSYSLIGVIVPKGTKPSFNQITDFQNYVEEHNTIGWTKVTIEKPTPPPTPERRWSTSFAYSQGSVARQMTFALQCKNIPSSKSYISFVSDNTTGPNPPIVLNKTAVSDGNGTYGIVSQVPADYTCNISFVFYYNGTPPVDSSITFIAYYMDGATNGPQKQVIMASVKTTN
jgi:hypothetical protein